MARRILNRKDLRADYDAAERRKQDEDEGEGDEEETDEEETDEAEESDGDEEEAEEEAPKKKKKAPAEPKPKRTRAPKVVRLKVVWGVFSNSNQRVATYEYPKKKEAEEHAARLMAEKKSTFFVQPIKEQIEEKKE